MENQPRVVQVQVQQVQVLTRTSPWEFPEGLEVVSHRSGHRQVLIFDAANRPPTSFCFHDVLPIQMLCCGDAEPSVQSMEE